MKSTLSGLKHDLGWRIALTLLGDSIFWGALVAAPFAHGLLWLVLAGAGAILMSATTLVTAPPVEKLPLPWLWFLPAVLFPVTALFTVHVGVWRIGSWASRMRFRIGASVLIAGLGLGTASQGVDRYLQAAGIEEVEAEAGAYLERSLKKASVTLLVARGLNGVISVLKSFSLSAFAGVAPGAVLDPVDDLVERFSLVMLVSTVSISAQLLLLKVGSALGLTVFLTAALGILLLAVWVPQPSFAARLYRLAYELALIAVVVRIGIPAAAMAGASVSDRFLIDVYRESSTALETTADGLRLDPGALAEVPEAENEEDKSFWARFRAVTGAVATVSVMDVRGRVAAIEAAVADLSAHIIRLLAVFVLEAMVVPLLVAWGLLKILSILGRGPLTGSPRSV